MKQISQVCLFHNQRIECCARHSFDSPYRLTDATPLLYILSLCQMQHCIYNYADHFLCWLHGHTWAINCCGKFPTFWWWLFLLCNSTPYSTRWWRKIQAWYNMITLQRCGWGLRSGSMMGVIRPSFIWSFLFLLRGSPVFGFAPPSTSTSTRRTSLHFKRLWNIKVELINNEYGYL